MASGDGRPIPKKNIAYRITFVMFDTSGEPVEGAVFDSGLASGSGKAWISKDAAAGANSTNSVVEIDEGFYYLDLTSTEMDADTVAVKFKTTTVGVIDTPVVLYPEEAGDIRCDTVMVSGDSTAADNLELDYDGTGYDKATSAIGTTSLVTSFATPALDGIQARCHEALTTNTQLENSAVPSDGGASMSAKLDFIYGFFRRKKTVTGSQLQMFKSDASTVIATATVSDDGTTTTVGEPS